MTNSLVRAALLLVCLVVVGCHRSSSSLVGLYSVEDKGKSVEFMRFEQRDGKFLALEKKRDGWGNPIEIKALDKTDFEKTVKASVSADVVGLGTNQAALYQVPKGWKLGQFESKTGYVFLTFFGPLELH